ncbi:BLUF domain-containing protein [Brevundimonas sp.]|uniref:BLUF domain-containing protein n=1 Tax=Brevundimonas sp. TaxID=1871086 RepID=UPI003BA96B1A
MQSNLSGLSGEQIRAARALARIDQADLAKRCGLSLETIKRLERIRGPVDANSRTLRALFEVFSAMGVSFDQSGAGAVGVSLAPSAAAVAVVAAREAPRRAEARSSGGFHRLIYCSSAAEHQPRPIHELLEHLDESGQRRKNILDITGIMYAHDGRFLSVLEGPKEKVMQVYGAIACDRRHTALSVLSDQPTPVRQFADWSVSCGRFESDATVVGNEPSLRDGFRPETLSPSAALGLLSVMRDLQQFSPRNGLSSRSPCPLAAECFDTFCSRGAVVTEETGSAEAWV